MNEFRKGINGGGNGEDLGTGDGIESDSTSLTVENGISRDEELKNEKIIKKTNDKIENNLNGQSVNGTPEPLGRFIPNDEGVKALRYANYEKTKKVLRSMPVNLKMLDIIVAMIQFNEGNPEHRKDKEEIGRLLLDNLFKNGKMNITGNKNYIHTIKLLPKEILDEYIKRYKDEIGPLSDFHKEILSPSLKDEIEEEEG